jgi:hypothetical protein
MKKATVLADQAASKDPQVGLQAVAALRRLLEALEVLQVDNARDKGWTWLEIALALGVRKQSVHGKHAERRRQAGKEDD